MTRAFALIVAIASCANHDVEANVKTKKPAVERARTIAAIKAPLCVTTGVAEIAKKVTAPAMRAIAKGTDGEAAMMSFTYHGESETTKKLASGELRRQIGLKLRAENGCNLIYVMWRLDPTPQIWVSVKRNAGAKDHKACGSDGYKGVKAAEKKVPPELVAGDKHTMRAEIDVNEELKVYLDDTLYWRGPLPENARDLRGPAGVRSDNLAYDFVDFGAPTATTAFGNAKCVDEDND